jgi:EAL domain-containing protein (putative c-di-GMP-specific phosphodiesterase class I)/CheY-like chemotaxis protein
MSAPAIADLHFLVAEDQEVQRCVLVRVLERLGARNVRQAANGRGALDMLEDPQQPIDIVITDLDMPDMDGMELIRRLGNAGRKGVSVILTSALGLRLLSSVGAMTKAYGVDLLGVAEKPLTGGKLAPLIERRHAPRAAPAPAEGARPEFTLEEIEAGLARGELEPFYQPSIDMATGRVAGAEALARWRHPEHGVVGPKAFISVLEKSARLDALTFLMLSGAAAACRAWRESGLELSISVNLSLVTLADTALADRITRAVRDAGLDPRCMVLEITETAAMTEVAPALENLARLRMRGFGLAVDDYGTGYSSLRQLTRVPFTALKVDRSFVTGCAENPLSRAIVESSLEMARRLDIRSIAEGVETQAEWNALRDMGCDAAQGYFVARPMDARAFAGFCAASTGDAAGS